MLPAGKPLRGIIPAVRERNARSTEANRASRLRPHPTLSTLPATSKRIYCPVDQSWDSRSRALRPCLYSHSAASALLVSFSTSFQPSRHFSQSAIVALNIPFVALCSQRPFLRAKSRCTFAIA